MTETKFASWVEPIAALYYERRAGFVAYALTVPAAAWERPAQVGGWTCKDLLAHVAGDTGQNLHAALRAIIAGRPLPPALFEDFDERNERDVEDRRHRTVMELVDELNAAGDETQRLLALLRDDDEQRQEVGLRGSLSEALTALSEHDAVHLEQLQAATMTGAEVGSNS